MGGLGGDSSGRVSKFGAVAIGMPSLNARARKGLIGLIFSTTRLKSGSRNGDHRGGRQP